MVKYVLESKVCKSIAQIIKEEADDVVDGIQSSYYEKRIATKEKVIYIYIIEKFLFRINSNLAITIVLEETSVGAKVEIISAGGSAGLLSTSFGAEDASVKYILKELKDLGFKEIEATN